MDLRKIYAETERILDKVPFGELFPSFTRYKFAIYNKEEVCSDVGLMPYSEEFRGNTAILFRGERTAIWNCEEDNPDCEILAYCLVHEMFHAFQLDNNETRFPDDLKMLDAPAESEFYSLKYAENCALAEAYRDGGGQALRQFFSLRNARLQKYPYAAGEELKAESAEGTAEFAGLLALSYINAAKYRAQTENYIKKLSDKTLLFDARRLSYYTGAMFCLTLKKSGYTVNNKFADLTLYEQNIIYDDISGEHVNYEWVQGALAEQRARLERKIEDSIADAEFNKTQAVICGYDPMNMFRIGDFILCSHFVMLETPHGVRMLDTPAVLKLKRGSDRETEGYYIVR